MEGIRNYLVASLQNCYDSSPLEEQKVEITQLQGVWLLYWSSACSLPEFLSKFHQSIDSIILLPCQHFQKSLQRLSKAQDGDTSQLMVLKAHVNFSDVTTQVNEKRIFFQLSAMNLNRSICGNECEQILKVRLFL